jgi:DNA-binding IclR family transcriptional regulator
MATTLVGRGWLCETEGGYWLGLTTLRVGAVAEEHLDVRTVALQPRCELLAHTDETVHLGTLDGDYRVVYLEKLQSSAQAVGLMGSKKGSTAPAHCTAVGKTLLVHLEPSELPAISTASRCAVSLSTPSWPATSSWRPGRGSATRGSHWKKRSTS